jgi:hypothetical protein
MEGVSQCEHERFNFPAAPSYADVCVKSACPADQSCEDLLRCMPDTQEAGVACGPTIGCPARMVCDHATRTCTPLVPFSVELRDHIDLGRLSCAVPRIARLFAAVSGAPRGQK